MSARTVLVTGAAGVVGRAVGAALEREHAIALVHSDATVPEYDETIAGDVSAPHFGLDAATWADLVDRVDAVVHSAAVTEWGLPPERYQPVNVDGARHAVELARAAGAHLHLVSSCFVRSVTPEAAGTMTEGNVVRPYVTSKREAEAIVRESGVSYSISRPTNLVGHHRTGESTRPQIVQTLSEWLMRGRAPWVPHHVGNRIDVVPVDISARVAAYAAGGAEDCHGEEWWVTMGERAMGFEEALEIMREHALAQGGDLVVPPVVDPRETVPVPLEEVGALSRRFLRVLIDVSESTYLSGGVLPSSLEELTRRMDLPAFDDRHAFRASLDHWAGVRAGAVVGGGSA